MLEGYQIEKRERGMKNTEGKRIRELYFSFHFIATHLCAKSSENSESNL